MNRLLLLFVTLVPTSFFPASANAADPAAETAWTALFNGKDLSGWKQLGGKAVYAVEEGAIVGTSVAGTPNSFLATEKDYTDFVLEFEFKVDPALNSGVQVRSHSRPDYSNGRVHGTQIEIDNDPKRKRWWTAGIYEEGRRGWLFPGKEDEEAKAAFTRQGGELTKVEDWNTVRVSCVGGEYQTWLNGQPRARLSDDMEKDGFIALQVHSVSAENAGKKVYWRNLRIQDLSAVPTAP